MTPDEALDDAELVAYVDGELDPLRRARIEARAAADPAVAARLEAFRKSAAALDAAFPLAPHADAVPPALQDAAARLAAALEARSKVVPLAGARAAAADPVARAGGTVATARPAGVRRARLYGAGLGALAASITLAVALFVFRGAVAPADPLALAPGETIGAAHPLHGVLERRPSAQLAGVASGPGSATAAEATVARAVLSFRAADGRWCREFEVARGSRATLAVACRRDGTWTVEAAEGGLARPAEGGAYATAAAVESAVVARRVAALGAEEALSAADESRAIAEGWRR